MGFLDSEVIVEIEISEHVKVRGYFDPFTSPEVVKSSRRLRMAGAGARSQRQQLLELDKERERYFERHCRKFEIIENGEAEVLSECEGWQDGIYPTWKINMAMFFGDRVALSPSDAGN